MSFLVCGGVFLVFIGLPVCVFFCQIWLARNPCGTSGLNFLPAAGTNFSVALLIPAHNEEQVIADTLRPFVANPNSLVTRILVVADNCNDGTAVLCRQMGVEVVERSSPTERGKGYALQFGLDYLAASPPDVVIVLDADCTVSAEGVVELARMCFQTGLPTQSAYLMHARPAASVSAKLSEFAWLVKTLVRPSGWQRLTGQCQLLGSGMAFPWSLLKRFNLASGHLVEDLRLTTDLAKAGVPVLFYPQVQVHSFFPTSIASRSVQSRRWEHGHLGMIFTEVPALLLHAISTRNRISFALALDMLVPPLSLLVMLVCLTTTLGWVWVLFSADAVWFAQWATFSLLLLAGAVTRAWFQWGRDVLSPIELIHIPRFVLGKLTIYAHFLFKREKKWNRSDRN